MSYDLQGRVIKLEKDIEELRAENRELRQLIKSVQNALTPQQQQQCGLSPPSLSTAQSTASAPGPYAQFVQPKLASTPSFSNNTSFTPSQPPPPPTTPAPPTSTTSTSFPPAPPPPIATKSFDGPAPPSYSNSLINLTPVQPKIQQNSGSSIYGTTYSDRALADLTALHNGSAPSFGPISISQLLTWCKLFKDRDVTARNSSFYGKITQLLRFLEVDINDPMANGILLPYSYFPLDLTNFGTTTDLKDNRAYDVSPHSKRYSPIEYYRFLVCIVHSLPYSDNNDVLFNLFSTYGLPLLTPIQFVSSLQTSKYLQAHFGYYKDTKNHSAPGSYALLYVSSTSDCDITFWFKLISATPALLDVVTVTHTANIYQDSYITMPYWHTVTQLTEVCGYLALCFNTVNMNTTFRQYEDMFAHFFNSQPGQKTPLTFSQLYEWLWYIAYLLNQFATNAPIHQLSTSTTCLHWLMKTFGQNGQAEQLCTRLAQLMLSNELFFICYGTVSPSSTLNSQISTQLGHYKRQSDKVIARKELSKTDRMLIDSIKFKLSLQIRDTFAGNTANTAVLNSARSTQGNTQWLRDMISVVKNC